MTVPVGWKAPDLIELRMPLPIGLKTWPAPCYIEMEPLAVTLFGPQMAIEFFQTCLIRALDKISGIKIVEGSFALRLVKAKPGMIGGGKALIEVRVERLKAPIKPILTATSIYQATAMAMMESVEAEYLPIKYKSDLS